jgi:hypothetical protein
VTLTGQTSGATRAELIAVAEELASTYFGTECVVVELSDESCETTSVQYANGQVAVAHSSFSATFEAKEHHEVEARSYGPGRCRKCEKDSWPQNPLP